MIYDLADQIYGVDLVAAILAWAARGGLIHRKANCWQPEFGLIARSRKPVFDEQMLSNRRKAVSIRFLRVFAHPARRHCFTINVFDLLMIDGLFTSSSTLVRMSVV